MITVREALHRVAAVDPGGERERRPVGASVGLVLRRSIQARSPSPPFDRSAMDGYAVRAIDLDDASEGDPVRLPLAGRMHAGPPESDAAGSRLEPATTVRILTGAPLPDGATAVVEQERVSTEPGWVEFRGPVERGANVRHEGEEVRPGDPLLAAGQIVRPATVALLLEQGIREVEVLRRPSVAVVATGDELVPATEDPGPGQIRDSVTPLLARSLHQLGFDPTLLRCPDDPQRLRPVLERALAGHRVVLTSGGVSVGDRDHVRSTLAELGAEERFWEVAQKPGKPLYFGSRGDRHVLGLPGNPVSAAVCFWIYGVVLLRHLAGYPGNELSLPSCRTAVPADVLRTHRRPGRTVFARARTGFGADGVQRSEVLPRQGSHMLTGMARADSLVRIPPGGEKDPCRAYRLPVGPADAGRGGQATGGAAAGEASPRR